MSLQFSRSMRSLKIDSFRIARIGLILAMINVAVLLVWFFLARVTLYETSSRLEIADDGRLLANFSKEALQRIRVGQTAVLRISNGENQRPTALPALVVNMDTAAGQVEVLPLTENLPRDVWSEPPAGQVEVEVEYLSPAALVMRASGRFMNTAQVPVSPQTFESADD